MHSLNVADYFKLVKLKSKTVGFLIALSPNKDYRSFNYKWFERKYSSFIYVYRIVIALEYQNKGLGKDMYNDLLNFSKGKTNRIPCEVDIKPKNKQSMSFHKKYGFREVGIQHTEHRKKEVSLMMYTIND